MAVEGLGSIGNLADPFQGFDFKASVHSYATGNPQILQGVFTGIMARIVNQSEVYLPLGQRVPRILDGEIITVWSLEQGAVQERWIAHAFGDRFATAFKDGRGGNPIPRQQRFRILIDTSVSALTEATDFEEQGFNVVSSSDFTTITSANATKFSITLHYARVDTGSFGVAAGKRIAMNAWQGTAQSLSTLAA